MSSKNLRPIGERIREVRKAVRPKLTTTELGRRIGVSNVAITRGEKGERNFSLQTLYALAQELKTDFGEDYLAEHLGQWIERMKAIWNLVPAEGEIPKEAWKRATIAKQDEKNYKLPVTRADKQAPSAPPQPTAAQQSPGALAEGGPVTPDVLEGRDRLVEKHKQTILSHKAKLKKKAKKR